MTTITATTVEPEILDRGIELLASRQVRRRFRRGLYKAFGSQGERYRVDIRDLLDPDTALAPTLKCDCRDAWYRGRVCKHITAAALHATKKGWIEQT